ncbi:MAG TPA: thioredoxin fold domain-containing protein [Candidatus Methanoperedens sp.]|nr:thioredoxin fold domain-containing protein [Candidatus Methanoperedens sp.]
MSAESGNSTGNNSTINNPELKKINLQGLAFFTEVEPGLLDAKSQGKPVFVYARSKYCGACKQFEAETFTNSSVIDKLNKDFILISIDVDEQKTETRNFRLRATPTEIFLDPNGTEIKRLLGYRTNQTFLDEINKIVI